jgi:glycosyltransferase involved in cell wall biosynthesis
MKKKLLVFHPIIAPYRIDFFNEFSKRFNIRVCLFQKNMGGQTLDYSKIENQLDFNPIYIEKNKGFFYLICEILRQLKNFNPDAVLCSEFCFTTLIVVFFKILLFKRYRILSIVDDSYNMVVGGNQFSRMHAWTTCVLTPFIDNIINVEPRVVEYYQRKYGKGVYMPIIVDDDKARNRLQRILPISQEYVKKYNLEGKKVLLFVGRLVGLKNVSFAVDAFLKADVKNSVFVIVGDGPEKEYLKKLSKGNVNIIFTGFLEGDALYAWYNIAQVFTLQSTQEAFGAVTNEALLGGCYCLVSKIAGSNCLIKENENGNIIDPNDIERYTKILVAALENSLQISLPLQLRENKMHEKFNECFEKMIKDLL